MLKVLDNYNDIEVVRRAASLLTGLLKDPPVVEIFKELKGLEILISIFDTINQEEIKGAFFVCFKLLSEVEFDLLVEMQKLGLLERMISELE